MDWSIFISCLDSYSDGTHPQQRIHWWTNYVINFSISVPTQKLFYILDGLRVSTFSANFHFLGVNLCSHIYYCLVNFRRQNPVIIPWGRTIPPCRFRKRFKFKIYRIDQHSDLQKASFYFITTLLTTDNGPFLPAKFHWNLTFRPNSRKLKQKVLLDAFSS